MRKWDSCKENGAQGGRKELIDELTTPSGDVIPRTPDGSHFLYLFKNVENGSYHIGKTKDLFKRRLTIRVSTKKLKIIHFVKIAESEILQILNYLRNKYKNQKTKKDWFNFSNEELAGVIEDMQNYKKTQKKATNERTIERKKTIIEEENILYNKKNIKKAEAIVGDFIRVGTDIFHGRVSEYLSNHYPKFLEQWQLNHKGAANAAVFEQLDRDYACCEFTNDRHVINTFRMVYGKIIEKSSPKYPKDTAPVYRASIPEKPKQ
jgi:predicted Holliday junction resolvase-like endonuclease